MGAWRVLWGSPLVRKGRKPPAGAALALARNLVPAGGGVSRGRAIAHGQRWPERPGVPSSHAGALVADRPRLEHCVHRLTGGHGQAVPGRPTHDEAVQGLELHAPAADEIVWECQLEVAPL